jgi:putative FmdB family regulatory protein
MPLYDFKCQKCENQFELFMSINHPRTAVCCPECGGWAKRVIVAGHGGIQRDEPTWLNDQVRGCLQDDDDIADGMEKPIETRTEYKRYLKEHGIVERA